MFISRIFFVAILKNHPACVYKQDYSRLCLQAGFFFVVILKNTFKLLRIYNPHAGCQKEGSTEGPETQIVIVFLIFLGAPKAAQVPPGRVSRLRDLDPLPLP